MISNFYEMKYFNRRNEIYQKRKKHVYYSKRSKGLELSWWFKWLAGGKSKKEKLKKH
jgi:hypothetical protein